MEIKEMPGEGVLSIPQGSTLWVCETCGDSFDLSHDNDLMRHRLHQQHAESAVAALRKNIASALPLVGKSFRVVYLPRYPNPGEILGEIDVTVVALHIQPHPCRGSYTFIKMVLDKEVPLASRHDGMGLTKVYFYADAVLQALEKGEPVRCTPCGKDYTWVEQDIIEYLQKKG